jgi:hypothetical protein
VRFDELLDWLGGRLGLQWLAQAPPLPQAPTPVGAPRPTRQQLLALREVVNLGYPRGVRRLLDQIEAERPECTPWLAPLRALAAGFQFDRITPLIDLALAPADAD